jgi:hypothetical protein
MEQNHLPYGSAIVIGFLFSVGVSLVLWLIVPGSGYFYPFVLAAIKAAFPLGIIGGLIGMYFSETRAGSLLGAAIMVFLGLCVIYFIAGMIPLD